MQSSKLSDHWRFMSPCDYRTKVLITLCTVLLIQVFYLIETTYLIETVQVDRNLDACLSLVPQEHSSDPHPYFSLLVECHITVTRGTVWPSFPIERLIKQTSISSHSPLRIFQKWELYRGIYIEELHRARTEMGRVNTEDLYRGAS